MPEQRWVRVEAVRLRFAAAHMATLGDDLEPLHGHNYSVACRVDGALTDDRWVIDFSLLKRYVREACEQLDHKFLLQRASPLIEVDEDERYWRLRFGERGYVFPRQDVAALEVENTTAELLAQWIAERVVERLGEAHANIRRIEVEVEEMPGQAGGYAREW